MVWTGATPLFLQVQVVNSSVPVTKIRYWRGNNEQHTVVVTGEGKLANEVFASPTSFSSFSRISTPFRCNTAASSWLLWRASTALLDCGMFGTLDFGSAALTRRSTTFVVASLRRTSYKKGKIQGS